MAALADRNVGFAGQVLTADWAVIAGRGARYSCLNPNDLRLTIAAGDRAVSIATAPDGVWGDGVLSFWNTSTTLTANSVSSGSRWDTVVIRRNWATSTSTLMILQGGTSKAIASSRTNNPGATTSDQPLWLIRVQSGQTAIQEVVDLRCWSGAGGVPVAVDPVALGYLSDLGTVVRIGESWWVRNRNSSGTTVWSETKPPPEPDFDYIGRSGKVYVASGRLTARTDQFGVVRCYFPTAFPNGVISVNVDNASGDAATNLAFELQPRGFNTTRESFWYRVKRSNTGAALENYQHQIYWIATGF